MRSTSQTTDYCIVCDDIRVEDNNKKLLIGVYADDIVVTGLPAVLGLCMHCRLPSLARIKKFQVRLIDPSGNDVLVPKTAEKDVTKGIPYINFKLGFVPLKEAGEYRFRISGTGGSLFEHSFGVVLAGSRAAVASPTVQRKRAQ